MTVRLAALCVDAVDPRRLSAFWAAALGWAVDARPGGDVALVPADDLGLPVVFTAGAAPKSGQNRNHLDLTTETRDDQRDTVAQLLAIGARHVDVGQGADESHVVLADPEDNELCVLAPGNRFLAGCGRLGAINCDGTRAGLFWSAVLGWPLVWDEDGETAIRAPDRTGPMITWSGPPLIPKIGRNRFHFAVSPAGDRQAEIDRVVGLGATPIDADGALLADPDGNEFLVVRDP